MKTNELIQKLSEELEPSHPLPGPVLSTAFCLVLSLIFVAGSVPVFSARPDLGSALRAPLLPAMVVLLVTISALAFSTLIRSSYPGRNDFRRTGWMALGLTTLLLVSLWGLGLVAIPGRAPFAVDGILCARDIFLDALIPAACLFTALRRRAPTRPKLSGCLAGVASAIVGAVAFEFCCANNQPWHLLEWHLVIPLVTGALLGYFLGGWVLRW